MGRGQLSLLINISVSFKHVTDAHLPCELPLRHYSIFALSNFRSLTPYLQQREGKTCLRSAETSDGPALLKQSPQSHDRPNAGVVNVMGKESASPRRHDSTATGASGRSREGCHAARHCDAPNAGVTQTAARIHTDPKPSAVSVCVTGNLACWLGARLRFWRSAV